MHCFALLLGHSWALPLTVLGIIAAYLGGARFCRIGVLGTLLFAVPTASRGLCARFFRAFSMAAYTWGACIVLERASQVNDATLLVHETEHTRQAMYWGALFPLAYVCAGLYAAVAGGRFYHDNCFERAARAAAKAVCP
jgi:hypothetical protein